MRPFTPEEIRTLIARWRGPQTSTAPQIVALVRRLLVTIEKLQAERESLATDPRTYGP